MLRINLAFLGAEKTGKSTFIKLVTSSTEGWSNSYYPTVALEVTPMQIELDGEAVSIKNWDLTGDPKNRCSTSERSVINTADVYFIFFCSGDKKSLSGAKGNLLRLNAIEGAKVVLVENFAEDAREVSVEARELEALLPNGKIHHLSVPKFSGAPTSSFQQEMLEAYKEAIKTLCFSKVRALEPKSDPSLPKGLEQPVLKREASFREHRATNKASPSLSMLIFEGFIFAMGVAAVALSLTVMNFGLASLATLSLGGFTIGKSLSFFATSLEEFYTENETASPRFN